MRNKSIELFTVLTYGHIYSRTMRYSRLLNKQKLCPVIRYKVVLSLNHRGIELRD